MNRLAQILHDHAGRLGFGLGVLAGCFAMVLSILGKPILCPPSTSHRTPQLRRHVRYPRPLTTTSAPSTGC
jgi:hypothetical protein